MKSLVSILTLVFLSLFAMNTVEAAKSNFDRSKPTAKAEIEKKCGKKDKKCQKAMKEAKAAAKEINKPNSKAQDYNSSRSNRRGAMDQSDKIKDCMKKNKKMKKSDCVKKAKKK